MLTKTSKTRVCENVTYMVLPCNDRPAVLSTENFEVYGYDDLEQLLRDTAAQLENRIQVWQGDNSGWVLRHLVALDTTVWELDPLHASNSTCHPLPKWIQNTKAVLNIRNDDNECFRHAVVGGIYPPMDPNNLTRVASYAYCVDEPDYPDFSGLEFPVKISDIGKFENRNDISINVFKVDCDEVTAEPERPHHHPADLIDDEAGLSNGSDDDDDGEEVADLIDNSEIIDADVNMYRAFDNVQEPPPPAIPAPVPSKVKRDKVFPARITKNERDRHVNLLITGTSGAYHYSTIKNFDGLVLKQHNKRNNKSYHCYRCLHGFRVETGETSRIQCTLLQRHMTYCKTLKPQCVSYSKKNTVTEFKNIQRILKHPFAGYADFESFLRPENSNEDISIGIAEKKTKQVRFQVHEAASYFTKIVSIDPDFDLPQDNFPQQDTYDLAEMLHVL